MENDEVTSSPSDNGGAASRSCSKCKSNPRRGNSSWCNGCLNEQAAIYRARQRKPIRVEERECAWGECQSLFEWKSSRPKQVCCSKSCYGKWKWRQMNPAVPAEILPDGRKRCNHCRSVKSVDEYSPSQAVKNSSTCRDCMRQYGNDWQQRNRDKRSAATRRSRVKRLLVKYGAPTDNYDELLAAQGGGCACCGCSDSGARSFHVDHDHNKPEAVSYRGLLCGACNAGLGNFKDDPDILAKAVLYLQSRSTDTSLQASEG